ncbi:DUF6625 family protein [Neobacillus drentensis]|uniref:DUF6625 family protein n=1 Tax=Neobacillus drentensis TaxID=220684 RepID=UPI002FFF4683
MNNKVALIGFYFGKLPNYFPLWLENAKQNDDFTFIIYTDDKTQMNYPQNVIAKYVSFQELVDKAQRLYDFPICVPYPYKFCDFRPAFGDIFSNDLIGFDFWGTIDLDIILGQINHFITDEILDKYDKVLTRDHFVLYRNTKEVNAHYRGEQGLGREFYKKVFTSPEIFAFGERAPGGVYHIWKYNGWKMYDVSICADINIWYNHFEINGDTKKIKKQIFYRNEKGLFRYGELQGQLVKDEWLYMHLQKRQMEYSGDCGNMYFIVPNRFEGALNSDDISKNMIEIIRKYNGWKVFYGDYERLALKALKKLRKMWKRL